MRIDAPTMPAATSGGAIVFPRVFISETDLSTPAATIELTGLTQFDHYLILIKNLQCDTNLRNLQTQFSFDNGTSYHGAAEYIWSASSMPNAITQVDEVGSPDTFALMNRSNAATQFGNEANEGFNFEIFFNSMGNATTYPTMSHIGTYIGSGTIWGALKGTVILESTPGSPGARINGIKLFLSDTGNFDRGIVRLYGVPL